MKTLKIEVVKDALIIDNNKVDAVHVNSYWIPILKNAKIETVVRSGYRIIIVNDTKYTFHRTIHEVGRPQLLTEILDLMKILIV